MSNFELTEIKITGIDLARLIRDALILKGFIPPLGHEIRDTYGWKYHIERVDGEYEMTVYRYENEKPEPEKEPYEAGDWRDPEVEEIINAK